MRRVFRSDLSLQTICDQIDPRKVIAPHVVPAETSLHPIKNAGLRPALS